MRIDIPKNVRNLTPYRAGKPIAELKREKNLERVVKLASNENPLGASPMAIEAALKSMTEWHRYPDPSCFELIQVVAKRFNKRPEQIVCGAGTDAIIQYVINAFTTEADEVLTSVGTFIGTYVNVNKLGRQLKTVPLRDYQFDLSGIAANISRKTKVIFLANPNNPTGTMFSKQEFETFMQKVPKEVVVMLDEAYFEYAMELSEYPNGLAYDYDNLIVSRTLSKCYGLAGLRIGFGFGPEELIAAVRKVKLPFEPSIPATAAAIAAFQDETFLHKTLALNRKNLLVMRQKFDELGIRYAKTAANFYMLILPSEEIAVHFNTACLEQGLIVRHVNTFGIPNGIRINSGTDEETAFALEVIEKIYKKNS